MIRYQRRGEHDRLLVLEGLRELQAPAPVEFEPAPLSRLGLEWEQAVEQLRWVGAYKRWQIAKESGRLTSLDWWSLEDALPYWF